MDYKAVRVFTWYGDERKSAFIHLTVARAYVFTKYHDAVQVEGVDVFLAVICSQVG